MSKNRGKAKGKSSPPPDAATSTAVLDQPEGTESELEFEEEQETASAEMPPWEVWASNDRVGFFDLMSMIPPEAWEDELLIYLYRLAPAVSNKEGDKKYICRYSQPIDEEMVKGQFGGGKYHAMLKRGRDTIKNAKFSIEGDPILIEGQTLRGQPAGSPASGAPAAQSDIGSIVRQVIEATKGDPNAANAGIRVMEKAMTDGLALNSRILENSLNSSTGNKVSDRILDGLLPRLLAPPTPDPIVGEVLKAALAFMTKERRAENPAAPADPMAQFNFVKDLLGVDSIRELFEQQGRRGGEAPFWVSLLGNAIEKLPGLFHEYAEMQERAFQRAFIAHQARAGQPVTLPGTIAAPMFPPAAMPPAPAPGTPEQQAQQMVTAIVEAICRAFDEGYPGDVAGAHLKLAYPQLVEQLKPMLADAAQLSSFVASIPALAERATDPDWPEFQADMIAELNQVPIPPSADEPPPAQVDTHQVTPGAPASVHVTQRAPARKKTNGTAA